MVLFLIIFYIIILTTAVFFYLQQFLQLQRILSIITSFVIVIQTTSLFFSITLFTGIPFEYFIFAWSILSYFIFYFSLRTKHYKLTKIKWSSAGTVILMTLITYGCARFVFYSARWGEWDAWAIWNLHAKFLTYDNNWNNYLTNEISWTHPDYPLFLSSLIALFWKAGGEINPVIPATIAMIFFLSTLLVSGFTLFGRFTPIIRIIAVFSLVTNTSFIAIFAAQYSDGLLAFIFLLSFIYLKKLDTPGQTNKLFLITGFIAASPIWIKNEGISFFLIFSLYVFIRYFKLKKNLLQYIIGTIPIVLTFLLFKFIYAPANDLIAENQAGTLLEKLTDTARYSMIIENIANSVYRKYPLIIFFIFLMILFYKKKRISYDFLILILMLFIYIAVYIMTPHNLQWHLTTSLDRLLLHIYPSFIFLFLHNMNKLISEKGINDFNLKSYSEI